MPVQLTCSYCQGQFVREKLDKRAKTNYCSRKCQSLADQSRNADELSPFRYILRKARGRSKKYNRELSIDEQDLKILWEKQSGICSLSGELLDLGNTWNERDSGGKSVSLDRIDSLMGYTNDNTQYIHKDIQDMKMDKPEDVFIYWCRKVAEHTKDRQIGNPFAIPTQPEYTIAVSGYNETPF